MSQGYYLIAGGTDRGHFLILCCSVIPVFAGMTFYCVELLFI
jgi:hypothetical protein